MVELIVASGKGGTGKTSLVGAFAELAERVVLVDCDVDAANLHLIVPHRVLEDHNFSASRKAEIDMEKCLACGVCMNSCRFEAISMTTDPATPWGFRFTVDPLACEGCGFCVHMCTDKAINFNEVSSGRWFLSDSDYGPFLHARLGVAQSNSGRLVTLLRKKAREMAEASNFDAIIVDGPPGIGCPVIASLTNASYLLIVTEPSLSALHDMERLVELARHFGIKSGICINKCDINNEISARIERFAAEQDLPIHGRIPFDASFIKAQVQGQSYLRAASPDGAARINGIWQSLLSAIGSEERHPSGQRFSL